MLSRFPDAWTTAKLGALCDRITVGHVGPMANEYVDQGITFLRSQNVQPFRLKLESVKYITHEFHSRLSKSALCPGDVVVVRTGYPGTAAVIPRSLTVSNCADLVIISPGEALDPWYLCCLFNSIWGQSSVAGNLVGVAQQHFNVGAAKNLSIPVPPLQVQRRIAGVLSTYDDLIEVNTRRIAILEEMAHRTYEEWFVRFRFPGGEGVMPSNWRTVPLEKVCERITDGAHKSPPSTETGLPMASVKDMHKWGIDLDTCRLISPDSYAELVRNDCKPLVNDILIAKDGANLNKHTILITDERDLVLLSSIAIIRPNKTLDPEFLVAQLKDDRTSESIKRMRSGAAIPRIVLRDFKRLEVLVPSKEIENQWLQAGRPIAQLCRNLTAQSANLRAQRDLLLPRLVSGAIDVTQAERILEVAAE